ncbi:hypothetical protein [Clostridium chauvoei]|uniref:Uncharacterized protein n=2 Tax=Clostridium chauvoei TaxID=46867 RepID=A0A1U6JK93_9CLOT|nr:hypothetical protein [Clostridium chauvoei]ATD55612.1 hypothetical protein BTM20_10340 [Clostridium chauvoei]MBX7280153.1 hypothetical protein [Clostridium chauvoei]MBX7282637.1 hypothetical protein [Clostridium chauvoei]MBX7285044.1 hypothetical protein [Clostridium chauvoei]MBX7287550.1 hypothetical protein [Clostridium chauvoei]
MGKKIKIIHIILIFTIIILGVFIYRCGKKDSIMLLGSNDENYFAIDNTRSSDNLTDLVLVTYNKENRKEKKYPLDFSGNKYPIDFSKIKAFDKWILTQTVGKEEIIGINTLNGQVKTLVRIETRGKVSHSIKDFSIYGDNLIYSYFYENETIIEVKNLKTNKVTEINRFKTIEKVPVSIYKDKVAYITNNTIYVSDLNTEEVILKTSSSFKDRVLLYKDKIYTFKGNGYYENFVQIDLYNNLNEKIILERCAVAFELYIDNDKVIYNNYFYDTNEDKLYRIISDRNGYTNKKIIIGDCIARGDNEYRKIQIGKNCFEYLLNGDIDCRTLVYLDHKKRINVISDGEIVINKLSDGSIINHLSGFKSNNTQNTLDYAYFNNKVYGIEETENGIYMIVSIDLSTGEKSFIKEVNEDINNIKQIAVYKDEIGYLIEKDGKCKFKSYNMVSKEVSSIELNINQYVKELAFDEDNILTLHSEDGKFYSFKRSTGNIAKVSEEDYSYIIGVTNLGIVVSDINGQYELIDYKLNTIKRFVDKKNGLRLIYNNQIKE